MTHTTNNDKSHKMKIATAILTTIAILCACNSHKPQSTNAEAIRTLKSIPGILNVDRDRIARIDTDR